MAHVRVAGENYLAGSTECSGIRSRRFDFPTSEAGETTQHRPNFSLG